MPCWYFEKRELMDTASIKEGMKVEEERQCRKEGAKFLVQLAYKLGLPPETISTGVVFFHRFYMNQSFQTYSKFLMATCCLFLAGKVEETPKKLRIITKAAKDLLEETDRSSFKKEIGDESRCDLVTYYERILLTAVKFDFVVDSPFTYLKRYTRTVKGNRESIKKMLQMAWTFINDSFATTLCLQWEPEIIAIAVMYLASKLSQFEITDWEGKQERCTKKWWEQFVEHLSIDILEDICHQVLDLLSPQEQTDSTRANILDQQALITCNYQEMQQLRMLASPSTNFAPNTYQQRLYYGSPICYTSPTGQSAVALGANFPSQGFGGQALHQLSTANHTAFTNVVPSPQLVSPNPTAYEPYGVPGMTRFRHATPLRGNSPRDNTVMDGSKMSGNRPTHADHYKSHKDNHSRH